MTDEEQEIIEFYRSGASVTDLSYSFGYSTYTIKKLLANEPAFKKIGYIWRSLVSDKEKRT